MSEVLRATPARIEAHSVEAKLAWKAEQRAKRGHRGYARTTRREEMRLPTLLSALPEIDVAILRDELVRLLATARPDDSVAIVAALTMMSTGRPLSLLPDLHFTTIISHASVLASPHGIVSKRGTWGWWLPAGGPNAGQGCPLEQQGQHAKRSASVWLPVGRTMREFVLKELGRRRISGDHEGSYLLFDLPEDALEERVRSLLTRIRSQTKIRASLARLKVYLHNAIFHESGGDAALASLITGRKTKADRSGSHYLSVPLASVARTYSQAASKIDAFDPSRALPPELCELHAGSRYRPLDADIRDFATSQRSILENRGRGKRPDPVKMHNAMSCYTIVMVALGTGFRSLSNPLPPTSRIDPVTGFMIVDDKRTNRAERPDGYKARLVWLCDAVRTQIQLYERHLEALARRTGSMPVALRTATSGLSYPAFALDLVDTVYTYRELNNDDLLTELAGRDLTIRGNAGRHTLRSEMSGRCSGEAIRAFLGHWLEGAEPWVKDAALDPISFRTSLATVVPQILHELGFQPVAGLAA